MKKVKWHKAMKTIEKGTNEATIGNNLQIEEPRRSKKWITFGLCLMLLGSISTVSLVANAQKNQQKELYMRYLTTENLELMPRTQYDPDKFLRALKSGQDESVYIAINRLIESFNDQKMRQKALEAIKPFTKSDNEKIADAATFAVDILSKRFNSKYVHRLADGSMLFTLFNQYSDYGSQNVLWRIKNNKLETFFSFSNPSMYIKEIIPSPDRKLVAVITNSNKSEFIEVMNVEEGMGSPELVESARVKFGAQKAYDTWIRTDHENYSYVKNIQWNDNNRLQFEASLAYNNTEIIENVIVNYDFNNKVMKVKKWVE